MNHTKGRAYLNQVHAFACKWIEKFRDPDMHYTELVDHWMADDCQSLGFIMDCGKSFSEKYNINASYNYNALREIIREINDIQLLGSAVYSQWRYFNHWAYSGDEILIPENRAWFLLALEHLKVLSEEGNTI